MARRETLIILPPSTGRLWSRSYWGISRSFLLGYFALSAFSPFPTWARSRPHGKNNLSLQVFTNKFGYRPPLPCLHLSFVGRPHPPPLSEGHRTVLHFLSCLTLGALHSSFAGLRALLPRPFLRIISFHIRLRKRRPEVNGLSRRQTYLRSATTVPPYQRLLLGWSRTWRLVFTENPSFFGGSESYRFVTNSRPPNKPICRTGL